MDLYLFRDEQQTGPYTEDDARALVAAGEISRECLAWQEGMQEWLPLEQVVAFPPPGPTPSLAPEGLPPVPARSLKTKGIEAWSESLEKRLTTSDFGPLIERHGKWVGNLFGGILLMLIIVKCRHGR